MRRKILKIFAAVLVISCLLVVSAYADSATVTGSKVNMRSGPGLNYRVVDCLDKGTEVTVTNRSNGEWYAINYNGSEGFMSSRYLNINNDYQNAEIVGSEGIGYIDGEYVRFRSGPSTDSSILAEYSRGKEIKITGTSGSWTACIINGQSGYVYSDYVSSSPNFNYSDSDLEAGYEATYVPDDTYIPDAPVTPEENSNSGNTPEINDDVIIITPMPETPQDNGSDNNIVPEQPEVSPQPTPEAAPEVTPEVVPAPTPEVKPEPSPEVTPEPTPSPSVTPTEHKSGYICGEYVRFRTGPSTSHSIIDTLNKGQELTITGTSGDWTACTVNGQDGFVYSKYVAEKTAEPEAPAVPETPSTSEPGYITANCVRFRSGPSTSSEILGEFNYGNAVTITGTSGDWTAVSANGQSGYVYSQYVQKGELSRPEASGGTELGRQIADYALQYVGYNYTWGGMSPDTGFDCSGFTSYVFGHFGYQLNRVACDQARNGVHVEHSDMQPGDLICFYSSGDYIGHVGIYIGNNMFVHAANSRTGVVTTELSGYYESRGYEVRRIV